MCLLPAAATVRIPAKGFTAVLAVLKPERLKVDKARIVTSLNKLPTKSLFDDGSRRISIFIVSTYVSLGCSGNTTRIMRRTLRILLVITVCDEQV
ncbi:hypothetical protein Tco_0166002 [Tanacetum coccineum]